jgi:hypothetical protein
MAKNFDVWFRLRISKEKREAFVKKAGRKASKLVREFIDSYLEEND